MEDRHRHTVTKSCCYYITHLKTMKLLLGIMLATVGLAAAHVDDCPGEFVNLSVDPSTPVCIRFIENANTWNEMRMICQGLGADLARLEGDLHHVISTYILNSVELREKSFWFGGRDTDQEDKWLWVHDNTPMDMGVPHWYPCDPPQPDGGTSQNHACLYKPDFYFHSCNGAIEIYGICQI